MNSSSNGDDGSCTRYRVLTTWTLWRRLLHPPDHPLFHRTLRTDNRTKPSLAWIALFAGSLACCAIWTLLAQLKLPLAMFLLVAMVGFSSLCVVSWVMRISVTLTRERERGAYDLLCLSPSGALGANWAICAAVLHRDDALGWLTLLRKLIAVFLLFILLSVLVTTAARQNALNHAQFWRLFLDMTALAAASYVEHVQSVVLGSLVGMLAPVYCRTRFDARLCAALAFLTLQTLTLLAMAATMLSTLLLPLLVFYLTREGCVIVLWRALAYHLNVDATASNRRERFSLTKKLTEAELRIIF